MTEEEKEQPFSFATRVGISSSTFHGIWTKGSTSIHRGTAKKIAEATGVDVDWLHKGVGVPYPHEGRVLHPSDGKEFDSFPKDIAEGLKQEVVRQRSRSANEVMQEGIEMRLGFNPDYIADALDIIDDVVATTGIRIDNHTKAEFIMKLCSLLNTEEDKDKVKQTLSSLLQMIKAS
ncbi:MULTISPECIES: helix-turn-helix domain-containing protein [unclassified Psychrobacter]|uniref:helix-turn-helix domain-containing protein n=1 Tax=unclassified Psychrobacter TaxID=196806 RepID=UPI003FCF4A2D